MNFKNYLLTEGKMEWETTVISRAIVNAIKNNIEQLKIKKYLILISGQIPIEYKLPKDRIDLELSRKLPNLMIMCGLNNYQTVGGSYTTGDNLLKLRFDLTDVNNLYNIMPRLKETIRHELEHSTQGISRVMQAAEKYSNFQQSDLKSLEDYFLDPAEIEAYVSGLYKRAKSTNTPFTKVVDKQLDVFKDALINWGHNHNDVQKVLDKMKTAWLNYQKQRFPRAY